MLGLSATYRRQRQQNENAKQGLRQLCKDVVDDHHAFFHLSLNVSYVRRPSALVSASTLPVCIAESMKVRELNDLLSASN